MNKTVDIKRVLLTTSVCLVMAILPLTIPMSESFYTFLVPLLFSIVIPLTSFDRIITKKKYYAFVISALLTPIIFFFSILFGIFLGISLLGEYSIVATCVLSGLLSLLSFSVTIKIDNINFGLLVTGLFALMPPFLTKQLQGQGILTIEFLGDPATFFIIWQTVIGLALAISIWTKTSIKASNS